MAQQADIVVYDGASTPAVHTLKMDGVTREKDTTVASWKEQVAALPDEAQTRFTQMRQKLRSGTWKSTSRLEIRVMENVSGNNAQGYVAPMKVAYIDRFELVNMASPRSTEVSKRVCMQMLLNLAANTVTNVTPVATGTVADLHQRLLMAS